jgi:hypothetical protein
MRALLCVFWYVQLLDLTIDRDRPRFHVKIADFGLARMVGPTSSIAVSKVRSDGLVGGVALLCWPVSRGCSSEGAGKARGAACGSQLAMRTRHMQAA